MARPKGTVRASPPGAGDSGSWGSPRREETEDSATRCDASDPGTDTGGMCCRPFYCKPDSRCTSESVNGGSASAARLAILRIPSVSLHTLPRYGPSWPHGALAHRVEPHRSAPESCDPARFGGADRTTPEHGAHPRPQGSPMRITQPTEPREPEHRPGQGDQSSRAHQRSTGARGLHVGAHPRIQHTLDERPSPDASSQSFGII